MKTIPYIFLFLVLSLSACQESGDGANAYGNFEATEVAVSTEAPGRLISFDVQQGQELKKDAVVGLIDTTALHLQKKQVLAKKEAINAKSLNVVSQMLVIDKEIEVLDKEIKRVEELLKHEAATQKQLDDLAGKAKVLASKRESIKSQNLPVIKETKALDQQVAQLDDQIKKAIIRNPIDGTVLVKKAQESEVLMFGGDLYTIADLSALTLRAYLSGGQLSEVEIGKQVTVAIDGPDNSLLEYPGTITWISPEAEFTPKIVQTREERVNLVYAFKVRVENDGKLKMGMPAEVTW